MESSARSARITIETSAACTPQPTGVARYTRELVDALLDLRRQGVTAHQFRLATRISRLRSRRYRLRRSGAPGFWYQEPLLRFARKPQLVHGTDLRVPEWSGVPGVATLHDVFVLQSPDWAPADFRARQQRAILALPQRCARVLAVSEATRREFLARVDCPSERVHVVHEGVNARFRLPPSRELKAVRERHGLARPYLLAMGGVDRRKNLLGTLRALASTSTLDDFDLAVVGGQGHGAEDVLHAPELRTLGNRVHRLGFLPDRELPALYGSAAALCVPSFAEGFGLPVLEAMACGTPVVAAERGALPEVAGGHAWLADPKSPESIAGALLRAVDSSPAQREAARRHAEAFTWERCARGVLAVYDVILAED